MRILFLMIAFVGFCHIADLPVAKMSAFCSLPKRLGQTDSSSLGASFPSATWIRHWAAHIAAYLHPRLSHDQPVLVTQLIMLLGVMVAVSDWLKVYPRPHPLLHGSPTTIHSFSRKASALAVRLGCPLIQIVCILLALESNRRHAVKADRPGLCIYTLCKARAMWMGHTYFGAVTHQLPWRMQLWVGLLEELLVLSATLLTAGRPPTCEEALQLVVYSLIMYFVPLIAAFRTRHTGIQPQPAGKRTVVSMVRSHQPDGERVATQASQSAVQSKAHKDAGSSVAEGTSNAASSAGGGAGTSRAQPSQEVRPDVAPRPSQTSAVPHTPPQPSTSDTQGQVPQLQAQEAGQEQGRVRSRGVQPQPSPSSTQPQVLQLQAREAGQVLTLGGMQLRRQQGQQQGQAPPAPVPLSLSEVVAASAARGTTLYRSPLQHAALSVKVRQPTRRHHSTAAILQQGAADRLLAGLPDDLVHVSSAVIAGCVQMFMWIMQLKAGQAPAPAPAGIAGAAETTSWLAGGAALAGISDEELWRQMVEVAVSAGAVGAVDVQVNTQGPPLRFEQPDTGAMAGQVPAPQQQPQGASPTERHIPPAPVALLSVSPACLTLPDLPEAGDSQQAVPPVILHLQLRADEPQSVRVLLVSALDAIQLLDQDCEVEAGQACELRLEVPAKRLEALSHIAMIRDTPRVPVALQLAVTTTIHTQITQPNQPTRLHGTATLLAAPAPLATELCSLYAGMEQEGQEDGLSRRDVWSHFWQPLMCDLHACLAGCQMAAAPSGNAATFIQQNEVVLTTVAGSLGSFFSANGMPGWQGLMQRMSETMRDHHQSHLEGGPGLEPHTPGPSGGSIRGAPPPPHHQPSSTPPGPPGPPPPGPTPPAPPKRTFWACFKASTPCFWVELMWGGFADSQSEDEWQHNVSTLRMQRTDHVALLMQAGMWLGGMSRKWGSRDNLILHSLTSLVWVLAALDCLYRPGTRRRRANTVLLAALNDLLLLALVHWGVLTEPGMLSHMSVRLQMPSGLCIVRCMQMQGTVRQWAPIGAVMSAMWILPQIKLGLSAAHITGAFLATWGLSCSLAVVLELLQRTSFLHQQQTKRKDYYNRPGSIKGRAPGAGKAASTAPLRGRAAQAAGGRRAGGAAASPVRSRGPQPVPGTGDGGRRKLE